MSDESVQRIREALAPWRAAHRRTAWNPRSELREPRATDSGSQFGGRPLLKHDEPWPTCRGCGQALQLFLQLNLRSLPRGARLLTPDAQWLQLFHCASTVDCKAQEDTSDPFSRLGGKQLRLLKAPRESLRLAVKAPGFEPFPCLVIVGWQGIDDYPHPEDFEQLGLKVSFDYPIVPIQWAGGNLAIEGLPYEDVVSTIGVAATGDKLDGWPSWVQGADYPACPRCGERMEYVFQLDSEKNLPYMFSDNGCGHITRCPHHPDVMAFGWACC